MIEQFEAVTYRGLRRLSLDHMRRVNLVTGPNGVGKSSLAEALWIFHGRYNPAVLFSQVVQRVEGIPGLSPLTPLGGSPIELRGREDGAVYAVTFDFDEIVQAAQGRRNGSPRSGVADAGEEPGIGAGGVGPGGVEGLNLFAILGILKAVYGQDDPHADGYASEVVIGPAGLALARPVPKIARPAGAILNRDVPFPVDSTRVEQFSSIVARGQKRRLLEVLRLIRPPIRDVEILTHQGPPTLWADVEDSELLPLEAVGGGMVRMFGLVVTFFNAGGGLIVVDEIENGIHHSALPELWQQVLRLSKSLDVQVLATTHSIECIEAAIAVADSEEASSDFVVHQMYQAEDGERRSVNYADGKLAAALELRLDLR